MKEKTFKLITLILSIFVALLMGEILLRILRPERMDIATYEDIYVETYSPTKGGNVISLKPNTERKRWGTKIKINSYGERDFEYSLKKKEGTFRIAVVGDSVAFGYGVALEKTFAKVLEKKLNEGCRGHYEVLLFGRPGYSISNVYYAYKDKIEKFSPDVVIYAMVLNDFEDSFLDSNKEEKRITNKRSIRTILKMVHRSLFSYFRRHSAIYNLIVDVLFKISVNAGLMDINEGRALDCFYPDNPNFKAKFDNTMKWLLLLKKTFKEDGKEFVVCVFPYQFQLDKKSLEYYRSKGLKLPDKDLMKIQQMIESFCSDNNINFLDLSEEYLKNNPETLYLDNDYGHPNEKGHYVAALSLYDFLKKNRFLNRSELTIKK
jgi:lysophospholipase L1-like esterase